MYARVIIEKDAEINGRTDRFGTGDWGSLTVLVWAYSGRCLELRRATTRKLSLHAGEHASHIGNALDNAGHRIVGVNLILEIDEALILDRV